MNSVIAAVSAVLLAAPVNALTMRLGGVALALLVAHRLVCAIAQFVRTRTSRVDLTYG